MTTSADRPAILGGPPVRPAGPPDWPPDDPAVADALRAVAADRSWGRYEGPHGERLRERLAALHNLPHVRLCAGGTVAVELALRGLGVGPGDEVLLAAYDFKANFADVLAIGAVPVLCDVRPDDAQCDLDQLEGTASVRTRAVLVSHLHGGAVDMPRLRELADRRGWGVVEDACQTPLSPIAGRIAGTWGDVGVLSFGGSKLLSAGRGGAVLTARDDVLQRIKLFTQRGNDLSPLSELQAAVLRPQLDSILGRNAIRMDAATALTRQLAAEPGLTPLRHGLAVSDTHAPGLYKYGLWYDPAAFGGLGRDAFAAAMRAEGIALWPGFSALHRTHSRRRFRTLGPLPVADAAHERLLVLHHPVLLEGPAAAEQIVIAVGKVRAFAGEIEATLPAGAAVLPLE